MLFYLCFYNLGLYLHHFFKTSQNLFGFSSVCQFNTPERVNTYVNTFSDVFFYG
jgi:hypothetical protein